MDTSEEQNDLVSDVIPHNRLSVLQEGLTNNTWPKRQLVDALFAAASSQRWDCLDTLIDHGTPLLRYNKKGQTVLHNIAFSCSTHLFVTEKMMEKILDIVSKIKDINLNNFLNKCCNANLGRGMTTLHQVVVTGHVKCTQLLLSHGADPNIRSGSSLMTPLMKAAIEGHIELVKLLLANNSNPDIQDKRGYTALAFAAHFGKVVVLNKLIEAINCNVNVQNATMRKSALMQAVWNGHTECVRLLLAAGVDVYKRDCYGWSVLQYAVESHEKDLLELILEVTDDISENLSIAKAVLKQDNIEMLKLLLKRGMPVKRSQTRDSVLHTATEMGSLNCLKMLLESKEEFRLDINVFSNAYGVSPLQRACASGYHEIVSHLLTNGASPDLPSRERMTPLFYCMEALQLATTSRGMECIKSLLRFGCGVDQTGSIRCCDSRIKLNMTPLCYSLMSCDLYSARMFVAAGAHKYNLSYSPQNRPVEKYPRQLISTPSERDNFMELLQNPYCLFHLSRTAVRNSLRYNIERKIEELPLPTHIKEFLNLPELEAIIEEYAEKLDIEPSLSYMYEDSDSAYDFQSSGESSSGDEDAVDDYLPGIA